MPSYATAAPDRVQQLCTLACSRIAAGDYDGARTYLLAARAAAGNDPSPTLVRLLADLTAQLESFANGVTLMERALEGFRLAEDRQGEVMAAADLAALLQRQGDLGRARTLIEWALTHLDSDNVSQRARLLNIAATIASFQGRLNDALVLLTEARSLAEGRLASWIALNMAAALDNLRRHAEAEQLLDQAALLAVPDDIYTSPMLAYARTWHALVQGKYATAYHACQAALRRIAPQQHPIVFFPMVATLGVLVREMGDVPRSEALLDQALREARADRATEIGIFWHRAFLARARGDDQTAQHWLCQALHTMQVSGYGTSLLWQPQRFVDLCVWSLERDIEGVHAAWLLQTSLAPWCAPGWSLIGHTEAQHLGSAAPDRLKDLTNRERDVLRLVAEGLRDREIAARLHVSVRTVQNHIQRCYEKLGVHHRAAVARLWLERGAPSHDVAE